MRRLVFEAKISQQRAGISACAPQLRLSAHGGDENTAIRSLEEAVGYWAHGLMAYREGELERAVTRTGVTLEGEGGELTAHALLEPSGA